MWLNTMVNEVVYESRAQRIAFDLPVRFRQGGHRATIVLRNLTTLGARVEGVPTLRIGDMAMIQLPKLAPKAARVVWTRGDVAGLEFERPLHPDIFETLVHERAEARRRTIADLEPDPDERPPLTHAA